MERFLELNDVKCSFVDPEKDHEVVVDFTLDGKTQTRITEGIEAKVTEALYGKTYTGKASYDLVVIGSGPTGMSAALNARTLFNWTTLIVEDNAPGGVAGSALNPIDNVLGVPKVDGKGVAPLELTHTWMLQIRSAGAEWLSGRRATGITKVADPAKEKVDPDSSVYPAYQLTVQTLDKKKTETICAGMVLIATGLKPRLLNRKGEADYLGRGVYYGALPTDVDHAAATSVIGIDGGGDTAAVAAKMFAEKKKGKGSSTNKVVMFIRGKLGTDMIKSNLDAINSYVDKGGVTKDKVIEVHENTEVFECDGQSGKFTGVKYRPTGKPTNTLSMNLTSLYVLIGGDADNTWLNKPVRLVQLVTEDDVKAKRYRTVGAVVTGAVKHELGSLTETGSAGLFAAGDVREGSVRRIAAAIGEGGAASIDMHTYLHKKWEKAIKEGSPLYTYYKNTAK
ncbi:NAD(P)/FAD-dependent oxidoreductase [Streptomyces mayteni]